MNGEIVREKVWIGSRPCRIWRRGKPAFLLIQPIDARDGDETDRVAERIAKTAEFSFLLAAFETENWNRDLSPWPSPPAFGKDPFGGGAEQTLSYVRTSLIPELRARYCLPENVALILGGYSLAGLFALWSVWQTTDFDAAAVASPSVWFPGWIEQAEASVPHARAVYLSLGDREERTRNPVMSTVGDCIRRMEKTLMDQPVADCILEWNEGNHFRDPDRRTARAFQWCMARLAEGKESNG